MKDFNEFLETITDNDIMKICEEANKANSMPGTGNKVAGINYVMTTALLRKYHDWLSEQIGK